MTQNSSDRLILIGEREIRFASTRTCIRSGSYAAYVHVELPLIISLFLSTPIFIINETHGACPREREKRKDRVCAGGSRLRERIQLSVR